MPTLRDAAAEAFAAGWVLSGAPITGDYEPRALAAIETALDFAGDPGVLEATLTFGKMTGVWATVYARREALVAKHTRRVMAAWNAIVRDLDVDQLVARFRSAAYLTDDAAEAELDALAAHLAEGRPAAAWQPRDIPGAVMAAIAEDLTKSLTIAEAVNPHRRFWRDTAIAAALAWLRQVYAADGYGELAAAIEDAIRSGMAEGEAGALALAASKQGKTGFDIGKAFRAAYAKAGKDFRVPGRAQDTVTKIIDGAGGDAGRKLASLAGSGQGAGSGGAAASAGDMASAVKDAVSGPDVQAVSVYTEWGIWAALGAGALDLYAQAGAVLLDWVDAGDGRVCATCQDNADNSPYTVSSFPDFPAHGRCRCSPDTTDPIPSSFLTDFLGG